MALDPTRRTGTSPDGHPAVSVTVRWVQQRLNALLAGSAPALVEDGVWGSNTQSAVGQYVVSLGASLSTGRTPTGAWYSVLGVDPAAGRVLVTPELETALSPGGTDVPSSGSSYAGLATVGLIVVAGAMYFGRKRGGKLGAIRYRENNPIAGLRRGGR